jgi:hypothetical protein
MVKFYLAIFDTNEDTSWRVMYKSFVICKNKDINGIFLQDLWFTHLLSCLDVECDKDIHFMLLISNNSPIEIENDLNRFDSRVPYTNEKPSKTCVGYYNFVLNKELINKYINIFKYEIIKDNSQKITLMDVIGTTKLTFSICNVDEKMYLMLPEFTITQ